MADDVNSLQFVALQTTAGVPIPYHALMSGSKAVTVLRSGSYIPHDDLEVTILHTFMDGGVTPDFLSIDVWGDHGEVALMAFDFPTQVVTPALEGLVVTCGLWVVNDVFNRLSLITGVHVRGLSHLSDLQQPVFVAAPVPVVYSPGPSIIDGLVDELTNRFLPRWVKTAVPAVMGWMQESDSSVIAALVQSLYHERADIPNKMVTLAYSFYEKVGAVTLFEFIAYLSLAIDSSSPAVYRRVDLRQRVGSEVKKKNPKRREQNE